MVQNFGRKNPSNGSFMHGGTGTSKCGIGTKSVLPGLPWLVPVPISVVPVPLGYCHCFLVGTGTNKCGTDNTLFFIIFLFFYFYLGSNTNL